MPEDAIVVIQDLHYVYPDGRQALKGVSLNVYAGEKVALVGPNGAGKSTLLLHLNGILNGTGLVQVAGLAVKEKNLGRIRSLVGLVFQSPEDQLFSPTVFEDVAFGPIYQGLGREVVAERVEQALQAVHMQGYAERISYHLSVGEKKRVAIATVLAMQPQVLALDEPSAGLDPRARRGLMRLLGELPQAMLVATHDLALVSELLPRVVIMDEGKIVADGPTRQILEDENLLLAHGLEPL